MSDENPLFVEVQKFRHPLVLLVLLLPFVVVLTLLGSEMITLFDPERWEEPLSNLFLLFIPAIMLIVPALVLVSSLTTTVTASGLWVHFFPFHLSSRRIDLDNAVSVEVSTFRPLLDYGGWGIRHGNNAKAYIVSGNQGLLIRFREGPGLLIGSRRANELERAVAKLRGHDAG